MKKNYNEQENEELYNKESEEKDIPFAVDEEMIQEIDYEKMPENDVPFAVDSDTIETGSIDVSEIDVPFSMKRKENEENNMNEGNGKRTKKRKKRKMKKSKKVLITILVILLALVVCVIGGYVYVKNYLSSMGISGDNDIYNLMTKVDSSKVEDIEKLDQVNLLLLGVDKGGTRSDSIMLVNYNIKTNKINLLSIPRDTRIYVEDRGTYRKITEVHAMHDKNGNMYGASAVAQAVIGLTGMDINYYMEFSFDAIDKIMNELGPVKFDVPDLEGKGRGMNYDDGFQDLHIHLKPGMQELNGNQIQQFLRYRKSNYRDAQNVFGSDLERVERQQALLGAIIDQKLNAGLITKSPKILEAVRSSIKTTFTGDELLAYVQFLTKDERYASISSDNMESFVLPGGSQMISGKSYFICDEAKTAEMLRINFAVDVQADDITNVINISKRKSSGKISGSSKQKSSDTAKNEEKVDKKTDDSDASNKREEKTKVKEEQSNKKEEKTKVQNGPSNNSGVTNNNVSSEQKREEKPNVQTEQTNNSGVNNNQSSEQKTEETNEQINNSPVYTQETETNTAQKNKLAQIEEDMTKKEESSAPATPPVAPQASSVESTVSEGQ